MKRKLALYDPYLDTLGGGEKHILSILKALEDENYEINIFWDKNLSQEIRNKLDINFNNPIKYLPDIFNPHLSLRAGNLSKLLTLRQFDMFFYVTDGSYFFSSAKKNFVFCMVPDKKLFNLNLLNRLKTLNYKFITNSAFTKSWLSKFGLKAEFIYPYLNKNFVDVKIQNVKKDKIILSVGRFFNYLHAKRQDLIINLFNKIQQTHTLFKDFQLILTGGMKEEDKDYFEYLSSLVKNNPSIHLIPNLEHDKLLDLYKKSLIYWHFAGFGVNEQLNPESVEHLGITPLEAMASGCITFAYNAGGPKEIIQNGENGYLFESENDLINKTKLILSNKDLQKTIQNQAKEYIINKFSYEVFRKSVREVILKQ